MDEILNNTLARLKRQDKGPSEKAYLVTLKRKFGELFKLGYELISTKCKHDDLSRRVYELQPIEGQDSKCAGCYKVQVAKREQQRSSTNWVSHPFVYARSVSKINFILSQLLANASKGSTIIPRRSISV